MPEWHTPDDEPPPIGVEVFVIKDGRPGIDYAIEIERAVIGVDGVVMVREILWCGDRTGNCTGLPLGYYSCWMEIGL